MRKESSMALGLLVLFILYYLLPIEFRDLWQPDETRYAEISREMLAEKNWIVPHFFGLRYFEKPIAGYWVNSIGQAFFGHSNFAVRAGAIFCTFLSGLFLYWLGIKISARREVALCGCLIFMTSLLVYGVGTYAVLDPILLLWMVSAICSYWLAAEAGSTKQRFCGYVLLGLACAMGLMTKGFLALVVPVLAILPWAIWRGRFCQLLRWGPLTIGVTVLVSSPWALAIHRFENDFWHYFFWVEHIQRFSDNDAQHKAPFWYYLPVMIAGCLPWLGLMPGALAEAWRARKKNSGLFYLLCWVLMPLVFFSIAKGKLLTYIMPCFAPMALLMAHYGHQKSNKVKKTLKVNGWINVLFGCAALLGVLFLLAPWGLMSSPIFNSDEKLKVLFSAVIFAGWGITGWFSINPTEGRWKLAALCPFMLTLLVGFTIPSKVRDSKQPQSFVNALYDQFSTSSYILANNSGVASAISWELQRSDIYFYAQRGELRYGLSYRDSTSRFVDENDFAEWLRVHRREGKVSLVLLLNSREKVSDLQFPVPDNIYEQGRLVYYGYNAVP